ncbi:DUF4360 domain-containing protein [Streptomyces litchfieldiae]|uniref:DUF4360 domain-containing protein n=1 Tax=Streptomyces litchfieldiae TaxID=3075543 RepID=A0ABU2MUS8_9ACTN|nr:DUF4360 domain-containing protein [Streptomyces sp. DSM 44938]MDT0345162.1 DUF4360 domain-containing protein [Streptomyces sp. DSM 44938]
MSGVLAAGGAAVALFASTLSAQGTPAMTDVPTERIEISIETINGSGCPAGTAAVAASADNTAFTVTYSDFLAQAGGGASVIERRKNCQLSLNVHIPQGFTYAIARVDYRGYAYLENGATALQKASYYFQGSAETASQSYDFGGPYDDNWHTSDSTEVAELVYAPCGEERNFNINTELRVNPGDSDPNATSFIVMDSTDSEVSTTYHMSWKECPAS